MPGLSPRPEHLWVKNNFGKTCSNTNSAFRKRPVTILNGNWVSNLMIWNKWKLTSSKRFKPKQKHEELKIDLCMGFPKRGKQAGFPLLFNPFIAPNPVFPYG